jgi:fengycin family lipopeptide synthetase D
VGIAGEIYVGGAGLARGYLNQPGLTAERFIANPFKKGDRIYKTGDLGRWTAAGDLEFIGRKDGQVKIRGYRIELGEVESALRNHPYISAVVVVTKPDQHNENELVAYLETEREISLSELTEFLSKMIPSYMLPAHYVIVDNIPLTPNGKLDRKSLPDPEVSGMRSGVPYMPPGNEIEEKLVQMWESLLDRKGIGIRDDFFKIGGHSIIVMKLVGQIHKEFNVRLKLKEVFNKTTVEALGSEISRSLWLKKEARGTNGDATGTNGDATSNNDIIL